MTTMTETRVLSSLKPGESASILGFTDGAADLVRFRELGLLPGVKIKVLRRAPLGDPVQIEVGGTLLAIRKKEAQHILVDPAAAKA